MEVEDLARAVLADLERLQTTLRWAQGLNGVETRDENDETTGVGVIGTVGAKGTGIGGAAEARGGEKSGIVTGEAIETATTGAIGTGGTAMETETETVVMETVTKTVVIVIETARGVSSSRNHIACSIYAVFWR